MGFPCSLRPPSQPCCGPESTLWGGGEEGGPSLPELRSAAATVLVEEELSCLKNMHTGALRPRVWFVKAPWGKLTITVFSNPRLFCAARQREFVSAEGWRTGSPAYNEEFLPKAGHRAVLLFSLRDCLPMPRLSDAPRLIGVFKDWVR